jgi:hypothetical protein
LWHHDPRSTRSKDEGGAHAGVPDFSFIERLLPEADPLRHGIGDGHRIVDERSSRPCIRLDALEGSGDRGVVGQIHLRSDPGASARVHFG